MIETELIAGLYDENDNLIATYEESGLIADVDYTSSSYTTAAGSGYSTFNRYPTAKKVILPASITSIGSYAFDGCSSLISITIPSSVTSIGDWTFQNCTGLISITIPASVTHIGKGVFFDCTGLTSVTIPDSITSISSTVFTNCTSLTSITIPEGVTSLGWSAFEGCSGLTSITIPNSVTSIGDNVFSYCTSLLNITIPDSITSISPSAFRDCSSLTNLTIPDSVTSIGSDAFSGCSDLTFITIPDSVTSIGDGAFSYCTGLMSITIPEYVVSIGTAAFEGCYELTSIMIPDNVTSIGSSAFSGCSSLVEMTIPFVGNRAGVAAADTWQYPFGYIFGSSSYTGGVWTEQYYHQSSTSWTASSTYCIPLSLKKVTVTGGNILYGAFYNCSNLTNIALGDNITSLGEYAFYNCSNLANIESYGIQSIDNYAFRDCNSLTAVDLPDSLTDLSAQAFIGCAALQELHVGSGLSELFMEPTNYDNGLYIDLSNAYNLETVSVHGNVYFEPALQGLGLDGQFYASDDGSLFRWNTDLNAWELVRLMPEAAILPSYFENSPVVSILADCIDDCHINMFNKDLVIPDTVKLLDKKPLRVWSDDFNDYTAKRRIHLLAASVTALTETYSGEIPEQDITINVPASLVEDYSQAWWAESWVQQIVSNDSLLAFVTYNQNLQETLPKKFVSVEEAAKLQDEILEQQSLIETLRAQLENAKPVVAHLAYSDDHLVCDYSIADLLAAVESGKIIKLRDDGAELSLTSYDSQTSSLYFWAPYYNYNGQCIAYAASVDETGADIWEDQSVIL